MFQGFVVPQELDELRRIIVDLALMCVEEPGLHPITYDLFYSNCELFGAILIALATLKREKDSALETMNLTGTVKMATETIASAHVTDNKYDF